MSFSTTCTGVLIHVNSLAFKHATTPAISTSISGRRVLSGDEDAAWPFPRCGIFFLIVEPEPGFVGLAVVVVLAALDRPLL